MEKLQLDVTDLRAFLTGDDTYLEVTENTPGYLNGRFLGDPMWHRRRSEIDDGRLVVRSRWRGQIATFPLTDIACVAKVLARLSRLSEGASGLTWLVDGGGRPFAEVPWGHAVDLQAKGAGVRVRSPKMIVATEAALTLRPERRL